MIELASVVKQYQGLQVVDNVSMTIEKNEICVFIGPSGAGKSTLLKMINKMVTPDSGDVKIKGQSLKKMDSCQLRRKIGYVIQGTGLFPHMTVYNNIKVVPSLLRWEETRIKKRVNELLDLFHMEPSAYLHKYPRELSGGEAQRVGVARALAAEPEILLMDEPFASLDPITRKQLQSELLRIHNTLKTTVVFVTHDMEEALRIASKTALFHQGRLLRYESPDQLLSNPDDFSKKFIGTGKWLFRLSQLRVKKILRPCIPVTVSEYISPQKHNSLLWVIDKQKKLIGWVDPTQLSGNKKIKAGDIMITNTNINHIQPDSSLQQAMESMLELGIASLPVVNEKEAVLGEIKGTDIFGIKNEVI